MRFSTALLHSLVLNPYNYFTLKKIYTFHTKCFSYLFTHPLIFHSVNTVTLNLFAKKLTRTSFSTSKKSRHKIVNHNSFLTYNLNTFLQNQSNTQLLTPSRFKSLQYRSLRRVTNRTNRRTKVLLKYLLVTNKKSDTYVLTSNYSVDPNAIRKYKLLQTLPYSPTSAHNFSSPTDSHKIFNFFTSMLKVYKRGARKQNVLVLHKHKKVIRPSATRPKNTFLVTDNNYLTTCTIPNARTTLRISPKRTATFQNKITRKTNLHYNWTSGHLNMPRSLQPVAYPLLLLNQTPELRTKLDQAPLLNPFFFNSQQYNLKMLNNFLTPFSLATNKINRFPQTNVGKRFLIGTELNSLVTLTLPPFLKSTPSNVQERVNTQVQQFSFVTTLTTKKFLSILVSQTKILNSRNVWENLFSHAPDKKINSNYSLNRPSNLTSWSRYQNDELYINTRLTHIRFKPGYSRQWRTFRNEFKEVFTLPNRYQYRLTKYLADISTAQRLHHHKNQTLLLKTSLVESKLAPNLETSVQYITKGLTFLNGSLSSNPNLCLTQHDFIQLVVSLKYYTIVKWQTSQTLRNKSILAKLLWKRGKNWRRNKFTFPNWVLNFSTTFLDTPLYLEVDHFSLSLYVLTANYIKPEGTQTYPKVLPLYNWKYLI